MNSVYSLASRRSQYFLWVHQHICAHCDVHILSLGCAGTTVPKIPVVEEISHHFPDG